ncbi:MAG: hypothetical protein IPL67_05270 [Ignavibacteria bacterium]|nr:hypothetical protein [Ignavibacteria bacterium]
MLTKIDTYENIEELEEEAIDDSEFLDYFKSIEHFSNSLKKKLSESESTFFDELKNVVVDNPQGICFYYFQKSWDGTKQRVGMFGGEFKER